MRVLITDDEKNIRKLLAKLLQDFECEVHEASTVAESKRLVENYVFDLAFVDLRLPDGTGIDMIHNLQERNPDTYILIITAFASHETAVEAMKKGAKDYVTKPFNNDELRLIIKNVREQIRLQNKERLQDRRLKEYEDTYQHIVGRSESMKKVFDTIEKISSFDTSVLITGETGTGKELVAKAIHRQSRRDLRPFIAINCASLPEELLESELFGYMKGAFTGAYTSRRGLIEEANTGSLFLDEIGEMPLSLQAKLLRFLEDKKIRPLGSSSEIDVDVRIITATNKNLSGLIEEGKFRHDLYYRLATFEIKLPSLKERKEDIHLLIDHFVGVLSKKFQKIINYIDPSFYDYVMRHEMKGNVRELKNIIEREIILSKDGEIGLRADLPVYDIKQEPRKLPQGGMDLNTHLAEIEKTLLLEALEKTNGNKTKAAELLGISFREFRYRLSKFREAKTDF